MSAAPTRRWRRCADADLVARGFSPGQNIPYTSDSLWSYEVGSKNSWFGGRMKTRLAGYDIEWSNIQQQIMLPCLMHMMVNRRLGPQPRRGTGGGPEPAAGPDPERRRRLRRPPSSPRRRRAPASSRARS
ncbi:MAG: hypothetical protein WDM92_07925 [Caulobacteraceae bacterium]